MKITLYRVTPGNYGDDLNSVIWPLYLKGHLDGVRYLRVDRDNDGAADETLLVGIGTILNQTAPPNSHKIIVGSGFGYGRPMPVDRRCDVRFVRGPHTARALGLAAKKAITDPAILLADCLDQTIPSRPTVGDQIGLMPHHASLYPAYAEICDDLGLVFIPPDQSYSDVTRKLLSVRLLITEAMHGAICADALRIPWLPYRTNSKFNDFKWQDWLATVHLDPEFSDLPAIWQPAPTDILRRALVSPLRMRAMRQGLRKLMRARTYYLSEDKIHQSLLGRVKDEVARLDTDLSKA